MKEEELEILEFALEGAKAKFDNVVRRYERSRMSQPDIEKIRAALAKYDEIKRLIEECKKENRA